jgi:aminobenzoyl-glutamate utilization protein B
LKIFSGWRTFGSDENEFLGVKGMRDRTMGRKDRDFERMAPEKETAIRWIDSHRRAYEEIARYLWENPELSLVEFRSSERLIRYLEENGFRVKKGISGMPTAFVATWGRGKPVIGFIAEYDALPNLSQKRCVAKRNPIVAGGPGHGCGHNLLGTSSSMAAIAARIAMEEHDVKGAVKVFGTPAEETLVGKIIMARDGVFSGTDVVICWHPEDTNGADYKSLRAMTSVKFQFTGKAAHAGSAPESGRSALDAVELMGIGTSLMRERVNRDTSIMHVITRGGEVPNIVPSHAEIWYFIRAPRRSQVEELFDWLKDIGRGAALMTQTEMAYKLLAATWETLPNKTLVKVGDLNINMIGLEPITPEEQKFGEKIIKSLGKEAKGPAFDTTITHPDLDRTFPDVEIFKPSWDLGNVSWMIPTLSFAIVTKAVGTPQHSWQMVSQSGSAFALRAGIRVSQWMAASALDFLTNKEAISESWKELNEYLSKTKFYHPIPPDYKVPSFSDLYGTDPEGIPRSQKKP